MPPVLQVMPNFWRAVYVVVPLFVLRSFVNKQTLARALTWRRPGAKSILEPVTTRNYDASRSFRATFSDDSFWVQQVTIIHPMYYIDQTSKAGKWYIILDDKFLYLLFKHRKGAIETHMIHEIIIDFYPSVSHCSWPTVACHCFWLVAAATNHIQRDWCGGLQYTLLHSHRLLVVGWQWGW